MKRVKVFLSGLMVLILFFTSNTMNTLAVSPPKTDKQLFAEYCDSIVQKKGLSRTAQNGTENLDNVYKATLRYVAHDMDGVREILQEDTTYTTALASTDTDVTYEEFEEYLNSNGVFIYSVEEVPIITPSSVGSSDVIMSEVMVIYVSATNQWAVTGGGYWKDNKYIKPDLPAPILPVAGQKYNVGGLDAVGVALYNVSGTKPTLVKSSGYIHDGHDRSQDLNNPCNLDSSRGVIFEFQDYEYIVSATMINFDYKYTYMGYGFSAQGIYNSKFAQYNGKAKSYYTHTWSNTSINSIGISTNGFNVSWTYNTNRWEVYSNSEKKF